MRRNDILRGLLRESPWEQGKSLRLSLRAQICDLMITLLLFVMIFSSDLKKIVKENFHYFEKCPNIDLKD